MKKLLTLTVLGMFAVTAPVLAQTAAEENVKSDVKAIEKDNKAIAKHHKKLKKHRADKAASKAAGNNGQQAVDSMKIGADKTAIEEKKAEKNVDEKILEHHKEDMKEESGK